MHVLEMGFLVHKSVSLCQLNSLNKGGKYAVRSHYGVDGRHLDVLKHVGRAEGGSPRKLALSRIFLLSLCPRLFQAVVKKPPIPQHPSFSLVGLLAVSLEDRSSLLVL